jgi:hypothetical protein
MNKSILDSGIPLLTEIVGPVPGNRSTEKITERITERAPERVSPSPPTINRPSQKETTAPPATRAIGGWVDGEWSRLEQQISERVLQQMLGRIDLVLEQHVRDSLADVLQTAVEGLATEIRQGLRETLQDVISRAVSQEIARLQVNKK